jgi:hypothetical protein
MTAARTFLALVHHPVYDRTGKVVTTAVTNLDIHDIARSARTYGLGGYVLITPVELQRDLVRRIVAAWKTPEGQAEHPSRADALGRVAVASSIEEARGWVAKETGQAPDMTVTAARLRPDLAAKTVGYADWAEIAAGRGTPQLVLFGTGWGLTEEVLTAADRILLPIQGKSDYNHLSVRAAVAVILDRLFGDRGETRDA